MKKTTDYARLYDYLSNLERENTQEEEYLCLALEWRVNVMTDGEKTTIYNWFDFMGEYKVALFEIGAMASADFITYVLSLCKEKEDIEKIDASIFENKKSAREAELQNMIDEEVEVLGLERV